MCFGLKVPKSVFLIQKYQCVASSGLNVPKGVFSAYKRQCFPHFLAKVFSSANIFGSTIFSTLTIFVISFQFLYKAKDLPYKPSPSFG